MTTFGYDEDLYAWDVLEDDQGNAWAKCGPQCDMEVVRPGRVQCSGEHCDDLNGWAPNWYEEEYAR